MRVGDDHRVPDDELDVPDDDDRQISQLAPVLGILTVVGAAMVLTLAGWVIALSMTVFAE